MPPQERHPIAEHVQTVEIPSDRVIVEVALHDRPEPRRGVHNRVVRTINVTFLRREKKKVGTRSDN